MNRREMMRSGLAAAVAGAVPGLASCGAQRSAAARYDAVVTGAAGHGGTIRSFASVQDAIDAAPRDGTRPFRILLTRGRWREKLVIDKPHVQLVGEERDASVLTHDTAAGHRRVDGEPWGTWGCASLIVRAPYFSAENLTIENAFDYLGHLRAPVLETVGANGAQAVALMLDTGSDQAVLRDVTLAGHQDTLFVDAGRSRFERCSVAGSVDFVFGAGSASFHECELRSRHRPGKPRQGYVTAPSTPATQEIGLVFQRCRLTREPEVPARSVTLGRAWRPTRDFPDGRYGDPTVSGCAAFLECWMEEHIAPEGWDEMSYTARDGSRVAFDPLQARLFEYASSGPGAHSHPRRRQLSAGEAQRYLDRLRVNVPRT